jgi:DNA-binding IclR family transcriptional regulator
MNRRTPERFSRRDASSPDRKTVRALMRGIEVLGAFGQDVWLGNAELADRLRLPKATVSRLTRTLTDLGHLRYSRRRRQYRLGVGILALGYASFADVSIGDLARPRMQELADHMNGVVSLVARDGFNLIQLETCHSSTSMLSLRLEAGDQRTLLDTAFGRALIAALSSEERMRLLANLRESGESPSPEAFESLKHDIGSIMREGHCIALSRWQRDISTIAAPLRVAAGEPPLALGFACFARQFTRAQLREIVGPRLLRMVREIEAEALVSFDLA